MTFTRQRNRLFNRLVGLEAPAPAADLDPDELREDLETLIDDYEDNVTRLAEALAAGTITLALFAATMRRYIRQLHLAAAVIASGGSERATPQARALAQQQIDQELRYLDQWIATLQAEQEQARGLSAVGAIATVALASRRRAATAFVRTSAAMLAARARSYSGAAIATGASTVTRARGLPQLPFQPANRTRCHGNCRCDWRIVPLAGVDNYDCYWSLGVAEHCPTCMARSRAANPLRVRNGEIVNPARYTAANLYA